jgi:hypothetical protein
MGCGRQDGIVGLEAGEFLGARQTAELSRLCGISNVFQSTKTGK